MTVDARWRIWLLVWLSACGESPPDGQTAFRLEPAPAPTTNPTTAEKVELGRHLFYDVRLSRDRNVSCASCHQQEHAFADPRPSSPGTTGQHGTRNAMSLVNCGYAATLTWFNSVLQDLENQALVPLVGESPIELGMAGRDAQLRARMLSEPRYIALFGAAFPDESEPYTFANVAKALASFQRTLVSARSAYDDFEAGDDDALSEEAQRGLALFRSERLGCTGCHAGFFFSSAMAASFEREAVARFENNGLRADFPAGQLGLMELTGRPEDLGKYKPPSLRNVALTAPYMHDGSLATLDDVLDHYARGGLQSATRSQRITGFALSDLERRDLLAFLESLSDYALLDDPAFTDPWAGGGAARDRSRR